MLSARKSTAGFWITVVFVACLVGYPLSFEPACWIAERDWSYLRIVGKVYRPLVQIAYNGPDWIKRPFRLWASAGTSDGPAEQPFIISLLQLRS
jgi:hypothetical protein